MIQVFSPSNSPFNEREIVLGFARKIKTLIRLSFSGSYVAGGDTLDLTNGGGTPLAPTTVPPVSGSLDDIILNPLATTNASLAATNGNYQIILPSAAFPLSQSLVNQLKVKIYLGNGSEYSAGAYGTDVLADVVIAELHWSR